MRARSDTAFSAQAAWIGLRLLSLFLRAEDRRRKGHGCKLERERGSGLAESETSANVRERVKTKSKNKTWLLFLSVSIRPGKDGSHRVTVETAAQACQARSVNSRHKRSVRPPHLLTRVRRPCRR